MRRHTTTSSIFEHSEEAIPRKRAALNESDSAGEMLPHPPHPCNGKSILRKRRRTSERASSRPRASEAGHTRSEQDCQGRRLGTFAHLAPPMLTELDCLEQRLKDTLCRMSESRAWEHVCAALGTGKYTRKRLSGSLGSTSVERSRAARAAMIVADVVIEAREQSAAAEVILAFWPRIFAQKDTKISRQIERFADDQLAEPPIDQRGKGPNPSLCNPNQRWFQRILNHLDDQSDRKLMGMLLAGPRATPPTEAQRDEALKGLFPQEERKRDDVDTTRCVDSHARRVTTPTLSADALRRWATKHKDSNPGRTGWSGCMIAHLGSVHVGVLDRLAFLWSRSPNQYRANKVALLMYRECDGWLIPRPGKDPRPIAAPQVVRRVTIAADVKRARTAVAAFCEEKDQIGCSGTGRTVAYVLIPALMVMDGGTFIKADREKSYQNLKPEAILSATKHFLAWAEEREMTDEAAAFARAFQNTFGFPEGSELTKVSFDGKEVPVPSPAQGCALSPFLQNIVLRFDNAPPGVVRQGAHDDLSIAWTNDVLPTRHLLPDTTEVGGRYNTDKSCAVGKDAEKRRSAIGATQNPGDSESLVQSLELAATTAPSTTLWGACVGDLDHWLDQEFIPRAQRRMAAIRLIATMSVDTAIQVAHRLHGPGNLSRHWARATPIAKLTTPIIDKLRRLDEQWVELLIHLSGNDPRDVAKDLIPVIMGIIFGNRTGCLAHSAAALEVRHQAAVGTRLALHHVQQAAERANIDPRTWYQHLLPLEDTARLGVSQIAELAHKQAEAEELRKQTALDNISRRAAWTSHDGQDREALANSRCILVDALRPMPEDMPNPRVKLKGRSALAFTLCRLLGLPAWTAMNPPNQQVHAITRCAGCEAPFTKSRATRGPAMEGVQKAVDAGGQHAGACKKNAINQQMAIRHDRLVRYCTTLAQYVGVDARFHNKQFLSRSAKRPADMMDWEGAGCRAIDFTVVAGGLLAAAKAEAAKIRHYQEDFAGEHDTTFLVAAVATNGMVGSQFNEVVRPWAKALATKRSQPAPHFLDMWTAVGRCYAQLLAEQAASWFDACRKRDPASLTPIRHARQAEMYTAKNNGAQQGNQNGNNPNERMHRQEQCLPEAVPKNNGNRHPDPETRIR